VMDPRHLAAKVLLLGYTQKCPLRACNVVREGGKMNILMAEKKAGAVARRNIMVEGGGKQIRGKAPAIAKKGVFIGGAVDEIRRKSYAAQPEAGRGMELVIQIECPSGRNVPEGVKVKKVAG